MFICPQCHIELKKVRNAFGLFWTCPTCQGRAITLEVIRKVVPAVLIRKLWQRAKSDQYPKKRICPACRKPMREIPIRYTATTEILDVCARCHFVWFDPNEFEDLPKAPMTPPDDPLSLEAKEAIALAKLEVQKKKTELEHIGVSTPEHWWELIPGFFGMPVEYNAPALKKVPWITWGMAILIIAVSLSAFRNLRPIVSEWAMVPAQYFRKGGLTFLTSFFLHAGYFHLIGNLYFFIVFGDNVEDILGRWRYLLLIILATITGDIAHILMDPNSTTPCIGASGGISGIMAYYALRFPKVHLGILILFRWVRLPAAVMFLLWILMQAFGAYQQIAGFSNVSSIAHLGGAAVGIAFWFLTKFIVTQKI